MKKYKAYGLIAIVSIVVINVLMWFFPSATFIFAVLAVIVVSCYLFIRKLIMNE